MKPFRMNGNKILFGTNSVAITEGGERKEFSTSDVEMHIAGHEDVGHPLLHVAKYGGDNYILTPDGKQYKFYLKKEINLFRLKNYLAKSGSRIKLI